MALKGITRIELTDVKTGRKEVIEKHNLVTNAIPDLLTLNPDGYLWDENFGFAKNMLPICPNAIGGILLYENPLEEDPDKYYAPDSNPLIGYSSNDVNPADDTKRGSMNQTESGPLEDNSGYRFVFDFATSQANGTISALGLTSKWGGISGYGSARNAENMVITLADFSKNVQLASLKLDWTPTKYEMICGISNDRKYGIYAYVSGANEIKVGKIRIHLNDISLTSGIGVQDSAIQDEITINTMNFSSGAPIAERRYYNFMDGGDGYIWGFEHAGGSNGNTAAPAVLNYIKISTEDFSTEEGTIQVNASLYNLGTMCAEGETSLSGDMVGRSIIKNGYLYCLNNKRTGVVKINLSNYTDVTEMIHPDGSVSMPGIANKESGATVFNIVGDVIYFGNGHIENDEIVPALSNRIADGSNYTHTSVYPRGLRDGRSTAIRIGPFIIQHLGIYSTNGAGNRIVSLMTPYLATINNLEKPVQKTADKTMKITYILREE